MGGAIWAKASLSVGLVFLMLLGSLPAATMSAPTLYDSSQIEDKSSVTVYEDDWNRSGVSVSGLSVRNNGSVYIDKPGLSWSTPNSVLPLLKTGAGAVSMPEYEEIWVIGGRDDANPTQNGDEMFSDMVEAYDIVNDTFRTIPNLPIGVAYAGAERIGDNIYVIGDWWPGTSNPSQDSQGYVQIYNMSNQTWFSGSDMPNGKGVGHAGVAQLDGYIYVAGGVGKANGNDATNRTYRYDPVNDTWGQLANMNNSRHGIALVPYHGKLYALGGGTGIGWQLQKTSIIEIYDPLLDNWSQPTNISLKQATIGGAAVVRHDEIVIIGGQSSSVVRSWHPPTNKWRNFPNLPVSLGDVAATMHNGTLYAFGGDMSTWGQYTGYSQSYTSDINIGDNISMSEGFLISDFIDMRPTTQATAQPRLLELVAEAPEGTTVEIQFRAGIDETSCSLQTWAGPDGTIMSWFPTGIHNISVAGKGNFVQYRVRMETTLMSTWTLPELLSVSFSGAHAAFYGTIPNIAHPLGDPFSFVTEHSDSPDSLPWLKLQPSGELGGAVGEPTVITYTSASQFSVDDPQGLLTSTPVVYRTPGNDSEQVNWTISLDEWQPSDHFMVTTGNMAPGQTIEDSLSHIHLSPIAIDDSLFASISEVRILGIGSTVSDGGVLPDGTDVEVEVDIGFADGTKLSDETVEWRVVGTTRFSNDSGWDNFSSEWTFNSSTPVNLPSGISGYVSLQLQVRTSLGIDYAWDGVSHQLIIDGEHAILLSSEPGNNTYVNRLSDRGVSLLLGDSGGPDPDNSTVSIWIEGLHDGVNGSADSTPQDTEYVNADFSVEGGDGLWWVNTTLNDTANSDHQMVHVKVEGSDYAEHAIGENGSGIIEIQYETRDARLSEILEIRPLTEEIAGLGQRVEPTLPIGWEIDITDFNSLDDIEDLTLSIGGMADLSVRWDKNIDKCLNMDERIIPEGVSCSSSTAGDVLTLNLTLAVSWSLEAQGLEGGRVDISISDKDGTNDTFSITGAWFLDKGVESQHISLADITGIVQGNITAGHYAQVEDEVVWTVDISHLSTQRPLQGTLTLRWDGLAQGVEWTGRSTVYAVDGRIEAQFHLPDIEGGLTGSISLWDIDETKEFISHELPQINIDGTAPVLQESQKVVMESRYALNDVIIVVNVLETGGWTGELAIHCQVRSFEVTWPILDAVTTPDSTFGVLVLFQFNLNMQNLGDASLLPAEAVFACWVDGHDDAGIEIQTDGLPNHQSNPWMELALPSNGPDLTIEIGWQGNVESTQSGDDVLVGVTVTNLDETIDRPINVTVWAQNDDGESVVVYRNIRNNGLVEGRTWDMSFTFEVNSTGEWTVSAMVDADNIIAELDEENNRAELNLTIAQPDEGLLGLLTSPASLGVLIILFLALITAIILRGRSSDKEAVSAGSGPTGPPESSDAEAKPPVKSRGPPPSRRTPLAAQKQIPVVPDISAASAALDALAPSLEETKATFASHEDTNASLPGEETAVAEQAAPEVKETVEGPALLEIGGTVSTWEQLPWGGEYEYDEDGAWYVGAQCGRWKADEAGGFTRIS